MESEYKYYIPVTKLYITLEISSVGYNKQVSIL